MLIKGEKKIKYKKWNFEWKSKALTFILEWNFQM